MRLAVFILALSILGCKSTDTRTEEPFEYRFERSTDRTETTERDKRTVTVRFDGVPFGQAMSVLSLETSAPIVWSSSLDGQQVFGTFAGLPLVTVLDTIARRCGSSVLICDNLESLRKIVAAVETIRDRSDKSYVAEVYFIRVPPRSPGWIQPKDEELISGCTFEGAGVIGSKRLTEFQGRTFRKLQLNGFGDTYLFENIDFDLFDRLPESGAIHVTGNLETVLKSTDRGQACLSVFNLLEFKI